MMRAIGARSPARVSVIVLLSSVLNSGCVVPVGPQFQDPPAAQNFAPTITDSSPVDGYIVFTKTDPNASATFRVTFSDPNLSDTLYVRWLADYPPFSANSRILSSPAPLAPSQTATTPQKQETSVTVDCNVSNLALTLTQHQIMVIIADRDFLTNNQTQDHRLTALPEDAGYVEAHWMLNLECK
ncbi:MAG TPA: hypothetical protein VMU50_16205 [Polyangia bacterium]|nr:hypothetical protein [Polyangia bacterium]